MAAMVVGVTGCATAGRDPAHEAARPPQEGPLKGYATGALSHLETFETPRPLVEVPLFDKDQQPVRLDDLRGDVVVVHIWATWVAPSRFEVPKLAQVQQRYAGRGLRVVPVSVDTPDQSGNANAFMQQNPPLEAWFAPDLSSAMTEWGVWGLPATIFLDREGREVARIDSQVDWNTPEVTALLDRLVAD
ncbi:hypothetical protein ABAC460_05660 [Asticcacaulis sp. AC460]|nr:hypothetical protein ABAC460_05660 [Asticcacaulis sp. AC460]